jgi:beta-lactamase regulating signal transducer with metallopeptidase domain
MNAWGLLAETLTERLAVTLLHFLWQGVAIVTILLVLGWVLRLQRPAGRYALYLLGLCVMAACPLLTFWSLPSGQQPPPPVTEPATSVHPNEFQNERLEIDAGSASGRIVPAVAPMSENWAVQVPWLPRTQRWIVFGWLLGVTVLGSRLLMGWLWLRLLQRQLEPVPPALVEQAQRLCRALHLGLPRLHASRHIQEAIATGLFRPMILIPVAWLITLPPDMVEAVLAHELAHLRRWDLWVNALQRLIETFLFYHPAVWWLSRRLRLERELCCDELAVQLTRDRLRYVQTLERVGRLVALAAPTELALTMGGKRMTLLLRVNYLLNHQPPRLSTAPWLTGLLAAALPIAVWSFALSEPVQQGSAAETNTVTVTVVDSANQPVEGAEVQVFKDNALVKHALRTDAQGQVHLSNTWPNGGDGDYALVVREGDRLGWLDFLQNPNPKEQDPSFRIAVLPLDQLIQGTLVDAQGRPLGAVPLRVNGLSDDTNRYIWAGRFHKEPLIPNVLTDREGRFQIKVPAGAQGELQPQHADWTAFRIRWKKGDNEVGRIQLSPAGRIEGRVVDARTGKPLAGASIALRRTTRIARPADGEIASLMGTVSSLSAAFNRGSTMPCSWVGRMTAS